MRDFSITKYGVKAYGCEPHDNGRYVLISDVVDKLDLILDDEACVLECIQLFKDVLTQKATICPWCNGEGQRKSTRSLGMVPCRVCNGTGKQ